MDTNTNFQSSNSDSRNTLTMVLAVLGMIAISFYYFCAGKTGLAFLSGQDSGIAGCNSSNYPSSQGKTSRRISVRIFP